MRDAPMDDPEFFEMYSKYQGPIQRYVTSLVRDTSEAEDITQETFLRAYGKFSSLREKKNLSSWLYRISTNLCYDRFRQKANRPRISHKVEEQEEVELSLSDRDTPRLDQVVDQKEMSACVQSYLEDLSDDYRSAIILHDLQGLTHSEIARMVGCSLATAKIRLHRARRKLESVLREACRFSVDERGVTVCRPRSQDSKTRRG